MKHNPECRGVAEDRPCTFGPNQQPRRCLGFGGRYAECRRRWVRARALADMRELRGLVDGELVTGPCERQPERRDEHEPERHEDPDGTAWTDFDVERFVDPSLDDDAATRSA